jgi:transmembrane sensor
MEKIFENIDDLIAKVIAGEASPEEHAALEQWKSLTHENSIYFEESKKIFDAVENHRTEVDVNVDEAWKRLNDRTSQKPATIIPLYRKGNFLKIAASLILFMTIGFLIYRIAYDRAPQDVVIAAKSTPMQQKLPDGSEVFVNKNSTVTFIKKGKKREVKLEGEAYFNVVHNAAEPFVINIDEIRIEDIGTAFNVNALPGSKVVEVTVDEGEVRFYTESNAGVRLIKGEKAYYDKSAKTFSKGSIDPSENVASYKTRIFQFNETSLREVIRQLNDVYGCDIRLASEELGNCKLSVMFKNENLEEIIPIITETLDLEAVRENNTITLKGEACLAK